MYVLCVHWCIKIHVHVHASNPEIHESLTPPPSPSTPTTHNAAAIERIIVGTQYAEIPLGIHIIRGENVVLFGEIDESRDPPAGLVLVSEADIKMAQKAEKEADKMKGL